jgi:thiamine biosynthesis lipoprotein
MSTHTLSFEAIGTWWVIDIEIPESKNPEVFKDKIEKLISDFDKLYSRFREDSLVSKITQSAGEYQIPYDGVEMLRVFQTLYSLSSGAFTPLIGNVLRDAGYDSQYSFVSKKIQSPLAWEDVLDLQGTTLTIKTPVTIDFGGIGKGFLIDKIGKFLESQNILTYCIDGGGDMLYKSKDNSLIRIGLENPDSEKQVIGVIELVNKSICASAGNKRKWGNFHHIMNPFTLLPENRVKATWVISDTATTADAIATCLFFTKPEILLREFTFEYLIIYPDNSVEKSDGFPVEFY